MKEINLLYHFAINFDGRQLILILIVYHHCGVQCNIQELTGNPMKKADSHANTQINDDTANNDAYDSLDGTFVDLVNYLVVVFYKPLQ